MKKYSEQIILLVAVFVVGISLCILMPYFMETDVQVYNDIISEVSVGNRSKAGELKAVWISFLAGIIVLVGLSIINAVKKCNYVFLGEKNILTIPKWKSECIFVVVAAVVLLFSGKADAKMLVLALFIMLVILYAAITNREKNWTFKTLFGMYLIYMFYYSCILVRNRWELSFVSDVIINLVIIILYGLFSYESVKRETSEKIDKLIVSLQLVLPIMLLSLFRNKYIYNGECIIIEFPMGYMLTVAALFFGTFLYNVRWCCKWRRNRKAESLISGATIVILFIIYLGIDTRVLITDDLWHPGEQLLPWHQVFEKGLYPYVEYDSASGLYPMLLGFFNEVLLDGTAMTYNIALTLFKMLFAIILGCGLYKENPKWALIVAIFMPLTYYTRPMIYIPVFLILSSEKLIKNKHHWLLWWVVCSFISGLYYPIVGVSIIVGGFPFAVVKFAQIVKNRDWGKIVRDKLFMIEAVGVVIAVLASFRMLIYMLLHILSLSGQSEVADGIIAYGNVIPPEWFLNYLKNDTLRQFLCSVFTFWLPSCVCLLFAWLLLMYLFSGKVKEIIDTRLFFMLSFATLALPINYIYTFIRIDSSTLLGRSAPVNVVFLSLVLVIILLEAKKIGMNYNINMGIMGVAFAGCILLQGTGIGNEEVLTYAESYMGEDCTYVNGKEIDLPKLGEGFVTNSSYEKICSVKEVLDELLLPGETFVDMSFSQELYYIFDVRVPIEDAGTYVVSSLEASEENILGIRENKPPVIIWDCAWYGSAVRNYYMYREILDLGYVLYSRDGYDYFISKEKYISHWSEEMYMHAKENMIENTDLSVYAGVYQMGTPNAWGRSFETLKEKFVEVYDGKRYENQFWGHQLKVDNDMWIVEDVTDPFIYIPVEQIAGTEADFIYLDIDIKTNPEVYKTVTVYWETTDDKAEDKRKIICDIGNGKLLIPLGIHPGWTFEDIVGVRVDIDGLWIGDKLEVEEIKLLQLKQFEEK